ncbi:hypothetical protein M9H77_06661 [Catharanthus roseus]|uniref:Uncharacterized protein n=1 Tax=Catharanthus roseus TaxID=4058 RepID=A0ACC0BST9_CATRO|nr:hypothetical protein M9H77_06661 [Catharanthus roseus]
MADWGSVVITMVLFVLLSPRLLFRLPRRSRWASILVHTIIFFGLVTIFLIAINAHIYILANS